MTITYEFTKGFDKAMEVMGTIIEICGVDETTQKHIKNMADSLRKEVTKMEEGEEN